MNKPNIEVVLKQLKILGNQERAAADQRYHKSQREHWGVTVPACTSFVRQLTKEIFDQDQLITLAKSLWETNLFDPMVCAAKILDLSKIKPSKEVWDVILLFLGKVDGWALEDHLAHVAWKCILNQEELIDELERWTTLPDFWMRRAALVYTLPFAKPGRNPERMLKWASSYASDPEWFIQKAIGWWLRVLGEHNPERVIHYLSNHWSELKGVAKKEGTRKLSVAWKNQLFQELQL